MIKDDEKLQKVYLAIAETIKTEVVLPLTTKIDELQANVGKLNMDIEKLNTSHIQALKNTEMEAIQRTLQRVKELSVMYYGKKDQNQMILSQVAYENNVTI